AGLGLDLIIKMPNRKALRLIGRVAAAGGAAVLVALAFSRAVPRPFLEVVSGAMKSSTALSQAFPSPEALYSYQFLNLIPVGFYLLLGGILIERGSRWRSVWLFSIAPVGLVALTALDLLHFGYGYMSTADARLLEHRPPFLDALQEKEPRPGAEGLRPFRVTAYGSRHILKPNSGFLLGLQDVRGYDSVIPRDYVEMWRLMEEPSGLSYNEVNLLTQPGSLSSPILDIMNVRYVLTTETLDLPGYRELYRGEVNVYRNEDALPRAFVVFGEIRARDGAEALRILGSSEYDPRQVVVLEGADTIPPLPIPGPQAAPTVQVLNYRPNKVSLRVEMPQEGYLVLSDAYSPGWRARLETGENVPVLRANRVFRAVRLKEGTHTVNFSYSPDSFRFGLYISFMASAALVLGAAYWAWRRLSLSAMELTGARRVVKNSLTPMAAQFLVRLIDLGFLVIMVRILGPASYGGYAFAVVLIGYFSILTDFGLGILITRDVAVEYSRGNRYLSNALAVRLTLILLSAPVLAGVLGLYYWRFGLAGEAVVLTLIFMVSLVPQSLASGLSAIFSAHERMEYSAFVSVITAMLRVSVGLAALFMGWGIVGLGFASVAATTATAAIFLILLYRNFFVPRVEVDPSFARQMATEAMPLMVNNMLNSIFFRVDVMLLQPMKGSQAVGYYSGAYKFIESLLMIPAFFTLALFPIMSRHAHPPKADQEALLRVYSKGLKMSLLRRFRRSKSLYGSCPSATSTA
ncbi:MAG: putative polysaccharide biosynthesis protein, partial [Dehalococcoidia bacterium]|nr:putative polysaccharide biosynthesis protein [Dehalococcoidia bacterium]